MDSDRLERSIGECDEDSECFWQKIYRTEFKVKVKKVRTLITSGKVKTFKGKLGKRSNIKKAIVTLAEGNSIDISTGV